MAGGLEKIARRYARALFVTCAPAEHDGMRAALTAFVGVWEAAADLRAALCNPAVSQPSRQAVLQQLIEKLAPHDARFLNFLTLLLQNGRLDAAPQIARIFSRMIDQRRNLMSLEIVSAFTLEEREKEAIVDQIRSAAGCDVSAVWQVDPGLIGGLTVKAADRLLDGSVRGALERLRETLAARI